MKYFVEYQLSDKTWKAAIFAGEVVEFATAEEATAAAEELVESVRRDHGGGLFAQLVEEVGGAVTSDIQATRSRSSSKKLATFKR